ncbi:hypothetical protein K503DRAFT_853417 [Rhizopogon vinicolor AM-OR11-026]|uniref:F-box domain-containing protein n=1 Tax=Rhizopogon vinicolor AM-OR11-026 TaxID=1314800 RepID=A0A1B7NEG8_9AGAM|nr:hypothetical protein K503DRAFT_853417 [Rhizopogon vinicolor AM-OR11-026]
MHISITSVRNAFRPNGKELSCSSFEMIQAVISFETLPEDLLHHIFRFLSVTDVIRLQRVSRTLRSTVLRDTTWYILYRALPQPRVSALLSTHSASYLKSWLTSREKFDRWCTNGPRDGRIIMDSKRSNVRPLNFGNRELPSPGVARRRTVELYPDATGNHTPYGLIFSRWLVVTSLCSSEAPVRCFDLDADNGDDPAEEVALQLYAKHSTVLYTTSGMIFDLRCVQSAQINGERVAFVILVENFFALKVFQFQITSRCSQPHIALQEVLTWHDMHLSSLRDVSLGPRLIAIKYARGGTFRNPGPESDHILCLDIETFETFTVPHDDQASLISIESMLSCTSHLMLLRPSSTHTLVEAYEVPPPPFNEHFACKGQASSGNRNPNSPIRRLQCSHEGVVGSRLSHVVLVHDPMFPNPRPRSAEASGYRDDEGVTITASFYNRTDDNKTFLGLVRLTLLPRDGPSSGGIATRILGSHIHPADPSPPTVIMDSSFSGTTKGFVFYPEVAETSSMPRFRVRAALSARSPQPPEAEFISVTLGEETGERHKKRREITSLALVRTTAAALRYTDFASGDEDTLEEAQAARKARATIRVVPCPLPVDGISARDILFDGCTGRMICRRPVRIAHRWIKRIEVWDIV